MRHLKITALALLAVMAASNAALASASRGTPSVRCNERDHSIPGIANSHVLTTRGHVILYRTRNSMFDTLWACSQGHGRGAKMGIDSAYQTAPSSIYPPEWTLGRVQVASNWVMVTQDEGGTQLDECSKYGGYPCPGVKDTIVVANALLGISVKLPTIVTETINATTPTETAILSKTLLSSAGAVAWLEKSTLGSVKRTALYGCLATVLAGKITCSTLKIAVGDIDAGSLRLTGTEITWRAGDETMSTVLR